VTRRARQPGEREPRIAQCWIETPPAQDPGPAPAVSSPVPPAAPQPDPQEAGGGARSPGHADRDLERRVTELEGALAEQTRRLDDLLDLLDLLEQPDQPDQPDQPSD
jgi:uncharacterized protein YceH (UPF0502 family)